MRSSYRGAARAVAASLVPLALALAACSSSSDTPVPGAVVEVPESEPGAKNRDGDMRGETSHWGEQPASPAGP
jgi:hypothetical protein